jgi:hypothetical protein
LNWRGSNDLELDSAFDTTFDDGSQLASSSAWASGDTDVTEPALIANSLIEAIGSDDAEPIESRITTASKGESYKGSRKASVYGRSGNGRQWFDGRTG